MSNHGLLFGTALGAAIAVVVCLLTIGTSSDIVVEVQQPTVVYGGNDEVTSATSEYIKQINEFQAGMNETAIAEAVGTQVSENYLEIREGVATQIALNEYGLVDRIVERIGTAIAYPTATCPVEMAGC